MLYSLYFSFFFTPPTKYKHTLSICSLHSLCIFLSVVFIFSLFSLLLLVFLFPLSETKLFSFYILVFNLLFPFLSLRVWDFFLPFITFCRLVILYVNLASSFSLVNNNLSHILFTEIFIIQWVFCLNMEIWSEKKKIRSLLFFFHFLFDPLFGLWSYINSAPFLKADLFL